MGRASLTIAINGTYNGRAVERAAKSMERLAIQAALVNKGAGAAAIESGAKWAEMGGKVHNAGQAMEDLGGKLTRNVTVPMVAGAGLAIKAATDLDTAFTNVKKTVDMDAEALEELKQGAIELSKVQPVSAEDILNAEALGGQLGIANENLEDFARVVSGLDIATDMELEQAAMNLAQFANITSMSQADMERYGSAIVDLGNNMATTESQISDMAMRVAAAGHQVGMSEADILGLSAALTSMGISAEAGGTAISTIMSQIDKDVATGSEGLATWAETAGMSAEEFAAAWRGDPVQALSDVLSGLDQATESGGNMSVMLEDLGISSLRQTDVMKRLAGNSEQLADAVGLANTAWEENAALQAEVDNRNDSLASKFEVLKNRAHAAAVEVGEPLADALLDAIDAAEPLIKGIGDLAHAFAEADEGTQKMVIQLGAAVAAAGPLLTVAGKLTKGVGNVMTVVGKGKQAWGVYRDALTTTNAKGVEAYQTANTLAARLGLAGNKAVKAAGGVDEFVKASKGVEDAADGAAGATEALTNNWLGLASTAAIAVAGAAALNAVILEVSGWNALVEGAREARTHLGDFAEAVESAQAATPNFDLAMSNSGQSVTTLSRTTETAMATIAATIEENMAQAGAITEEGAQRIAEALETALDATTQKAEGYGAVIESYAATVGESLDAGQFAQYVADVNGAFDQGRADLDDSLNQQIQAISAYHQAVGDMGSEAYQADIDAARSAHSQAVAELERYKDDALSKSNEMFTQLEQDTCEGWGRAAEGAAGFKDDISAFWSSGPIYSSTYQNYVKGEFAKLTSDLDMQSTGAWLAAAAATVEAGGELDLASQQNVQAIIDTFDGLPGALEPEGTEAMQALAASIEAAGVDLGDTANMSGQQIVDALKAKFGELPAITSRAGNQANVRLSSSLGATQAPSSAALGVNAAVNGALGQMPAQAGAQGSRAGSSLAGGLRGSYATVSGAAGSLASAQKGADMSGSSYTWGTHLGSNLASGIRSKIGSVISAAQEMAASIAARLKHSTPAMGPLSDDDVWGVHLVENIERGMLSGVPALERAAMADALAIERGFSPNVGSIGSYARSRGIPATTADYMRNRAMAHQAAVQADGGRGPVSIVNNVYERQDAYVGAAIFTRSILAEIGE